MQPRDRPRVDPAVVPAQLGIQYQYSYLNQQDVKVGSEANLGFFRRLVNSYSNEPTAPEPEDPGAPPTRRALPAPVQGAADALLRLHRAPHRRQRHLGLPADGCPLQGPQWATLEGQPNQDLRLGDPSYNASTSRGSNIPLSYSIVPNQLELSQLILIFERPLDTVQQDHFDWGFRFTNLYGIDFRYTTAKGYFSNQLLKHNHLYGYDPLQMHLDLYFPERRRGTVLRIGRYISPLDIEAQLSPDNFLYTHSNMYAYDPYTFTGIQFTTKINDNFTVMYGVHSGNDLAPWTTSSQPNGEILLRWVAPNNKDSVYGGLDSIGHGYYKNGHDDLQVFGVT